jgi:ADP-L-glycero-D-manno-heptose 6-epimerase
VTVDAVIENRVLITGAGGFIGGVLANYLEHRGYNVTRFDINLGNSGIPDLLNQDIVIHLGANSSTTETNLQKILEENFEYSVELYEMCEVLEIKFQYASSASVYGISKSFKESDFCKPLSPYAFSKYMFDCWLMNQNYPYQGFRYFNVYGLGEDKKGDQASPISKFIKQAQGSGEITLFENSEKYKRDFVCVEDVCEIHYKMLQNSASGIFNIGTANPISFRDVADIVKANSHCTIKEIPMPKELKAQYQKFTKADNSKILDIVGEFEWKSVKEYVEDNIDVFLN